MKKHPIIILVFSFLLIGSVLGQNDSVPRNKMNNAKNTIFIGILGNGGLISFNYDRILIEKKHHKVSVGGGISSSVITPLLFSGHEPHIVSPMGIPWLHNGIYEGDELYNYSLVIPTEINYLLGKTCSFEMGCGLTGDIHLNDNLYGSRLYLFIKPAGFRYQRKDGGFFFRVGVVPSFKLLLYKNEFLFDPIRYYFSYISFNFGYTIKKKK